MAEGFNFFLWPNENNYFSNLFNYLLLLEIKVLAKTVPTKVPEIYCGQLPKNSFNKDFFLESKFKRSFLYFRSI